MKHEKEIREIREKLDDLACLIDNLVDEMTHEWEEMSSDVSDEEEHENYDVRDTLADVSVELCEQYDNIGELLQTYLGEDCLNN